jgi:hypothetical protein
MLIYEWTSGLSLSPLRIPDRKTDFTYFIIKLKLKNIDLGFSLNKSNSIVLTITYTKEQRMHKDRSGIILYISTQV